MLAVCIKPHPSSVSVKTLSLDWREEKDEERSGRLSLGSVEAAPISYNREEKRHSPRYSVVCFMTPPLFNGMRNEFLYIVLTNLYNANAFCFP